MSRCPSELPVLFLHVAPPFAYKSSCPLIVGVSVGVGLWTGVCPPHRPWLPASDIQQTFLSINLLLYWLLSGDQLDPTFGYVMTPL